MAVFTCMFIVVFLFLFFSGLALNLRQLDTLSEAIPIDARISNLNGTSRSEILVKESVIQALEDSKHVTDLNYTAQIAIVLGDVTEEAAAAMGQGDMTFPFGLGVNRMDALYEVSEAEISFMEGSGPEVLAGADPVCVMSEQEMGEKGLAPGDTVRVTLFSTTYPNDNAMKKYIRLGGVDVRIVGSFRIPTGGNAARTVQVIFPVKWIRQIHTQAGVMFLRIRLIFVSQIHWNSMPSSPR